MSSPAPRRVVFVGIDGATWKIIEPLARAGKLPNLAAMMKAGTRGILESTIPVNSSVAWASFMTGCDAGKHGVFFFREQRHGSYQRPIIRFDSIQAPTIFRLASDHGRRVVSVTMPLTYPPEPVNGAMIGGLLTPDRDSDFIHPPELRAELQEAIGDVPADNEPEKLFHAGDLEGALQSLYHVTEQVTRMAEHLLKTRDPDLLTVVFRGVDLVCHQALCATDPEWARAHPEEARRFGHLVEDMYRRVDASLGRIRDLARRLSEEQGRELVLAVGSDHGFGQLSYRYYLNKWLVDQGYLVLKRGAGSTGALRLWLQRKWTGLLRRTGILRRLHARGRALPKGPEQTYMEMVDWSRTRAWSSFSGGEDIILINLKGREPEGIVEPGAEYEALRNEILERIKTLEAPDGTRIIDRAFRREELWQGPQLEQAPDIQLVTLNTSCNMAASPVHPVTVERALDGRPAMHAIDGIYLFEAPGVVQEGQRLDGPGIADMGPTLLHLLGLPVEDYMDGEVLQEMFEPAWREAHPVQIREGHVRLESRRRDGGQMSAEEEAKLLETMQALGYME